MTFTREELERIKNTRGMLRQQDSHEYRLAAQCLSLMAQLDKMEPARGIAINIILVEEGPGHTRFVEIENSRGKSISIGTRTIVQGKDEDDPEYTHLRITVDEIIKNPRT